MSHTMPVLPRYGAGSLCDIVPHICSPVRSGPPEWWPTSAVGATRTVLLVVDGLGWNQLLARPGLAPFLSAMDGSFVTSVAPTTTATALTSIVTGLTPGEHGLIGYRIDMGGTVMNTLRWADDRGDLRRRYPPRVVQPCPPFLGLAVPVVSRADLEGTGFTEAHLAGSRPMGWRVASNIAVTVRRALLDGASFVYAYYDGVDKVAHEHGFGPYYDAEVAAADALVADVAAALPPGTVLLVTADHGQVHVGENTLRLPEEVAVHLRHQSGEGRFRWLHARRGREGDLAEACEVFAEVAWVVTREQVIDEGWFGPRVSEVASRRMGDVALVPFDAVSFEDPADSGPFPLVCRHGSLTADEVLVPFLSFRA